MNPMLDTDQRVPHAPPRFRRFLFGAPRDFKDPRTYHRISLAAFFAWVGLGADGLSSSCYGPDEGFRALEEHTYLAVALSLATAFTILVISAAYSRIIEHFPYGGGGYMVTTRLLGPHVGVVSGSALLIDYILTISVSIASGVDQVFSVLPAHWQSYKLVAAVAVIVWMVIINLRGTKESVAILTPVFLLFIASHAVLVFGGIASHLFEVPRVAREVSDGFRGGYQSIGFLGMMGLLIHAYSMGGGTYTGIEAVSNGLQIMREPKVATAKRTMVYMAISLAVTASGITVCYLLFSVKPEAGKTMNAVLLERFSGDWKPGGLPLGHGFVILALAAEAALLFVAAQAGYIDGPRVMANMATDSWLPHRFSALSDRLTMHYGVLLMGGGSLATLLYTKGNITALVTMYAINVFLTFSLSQLGMCRFWLRGGRLREGWKGSFPIHLVAFVLCASILVLVIKEKFSQGAWVTVVITGTLVGFCYVVRHHYTRVTQSFRQLDEIMNQLPATATAEPKPLDPSQPTAVMLVGSYSGLGIHAILSVQKLFPGHFKNFLFVSVGVIDSATMTGVEEVERVRKQTEAALTRYVDVARRLGLAADYRMAVGTEAVAEAEKLCTEIGREFSRTIFFAGKLIFEEEKWFQRILHNETAQQLQRRLLFLGLNAMVLPIRVFVGQRPK